MKRFALLVTAGLFLLPVTGFCSLIEGVLNATGTVDITTGAIDFVGNLLNINSPASTQVGGFTALAGTTATIDNITNPPDATGVLTTPVTDFITFSAAPNISITFTELPAGIDGAAGCTATPPAAGQLCTPDLPSQSPFNLQNTSATSSFASFQVVGVEVDSSTGDTIPITGTFTEPFSNENFQQILATVAGGGTVETAFSAQFSTAVVSAVPEPHTGALLLLAALPGIWFLRNRKRCQQ